MHLRPLAALAATSLTGAVLLAGCGSSKPAYCTQVNNFKESIKTLEDVELSPSNISTITQDVEKVGTTAKELQSALGTEFSPQISAMKTSVEVLAATVKGLAASPSSTTLVQAISAASTQTEALKKAATEVQEVTKTKCD